MVKLTQQEIENNLNSIDTAWILRNNFLHREFIFRDFIEAFSFMTAVAMYAEKYAHHPNWSNIYNKVVVDFNTHDAGGITVKDFDLAKMIDKLI